MTVNEIVESRILGVIIAHDLEEFLHKEEKDLLWILSCMVEQILKDLSYEVTNK